MRPREVPTLMNWLSYRPASLMREHVYWLGSRPSEAVRGLPLTRSCAAFQESGGHADDCALRRWHVEIPSNFKRFFLWDEGAFIHALRVYFVAIAFATGRTLGSRGNTLAEHNRCHKTICRNMASFWPN